MRLLCQARVTSKLVLAAIGESFIQPNSSTAMQTTSRLRIAPLPATDTTITDAVRACCEECIASYDIHVSCLLAFTFLSDRVLLRLRFVLHNEMVVIL